VKRVLQRIYTSAGLLSVPSTIVMSLCFSRNIQIPNFQEEKFVPSNLMIWLTSLEVELAISNV